MCAVHSCDSRVLLCVASRVFRGQRALSVTFGCRLSSSLLPTSPKLLLYGGTTLHGHSCMTSSISHLTVPRCLVVCSRHRDGHVPCELCATGPPTAGCATAPAVQQVSQPAWLAAFVDGRHGLSDASIGRHGWCRAVCCCDSRSLLTGSAVSHQDSSAESTVMLVTIPNIYSFGALRILPFHFESANSVGYAFICFRVVDACKPFEDFF